MKETELNIEVLIEDLTNVLKTHGMEKRTGIPNSTLAESMWNHALNTTKTVAALFDYIRETNKRNEETKG